MYIEKYWGEYIGGTDDSLNLIAFLEDRNIFADSSHLLHVFVGNKLVNCSCKVCRSVFICWIFWSYSSSSPVRVAV